MISKPLAWVFDSKHKVGPMHVGRKVDECEHNDTCKLQIYVDYTIIYMCNIFHIHGLPIFGNLCKGMLILCSIYVDVYECPYPK